jgi:acyl-CoA synthetase (AMP-forming)/AMP-acid ligase II
MLSSDRAAGHRFSVADGADVVSRLRQDARDAGDRRALVGLDERGDPHRSFGYRELDRRARSLAVFLGDRVKKGDRIVLAFHEPLEFVAALFGCAYAGLIGVPVPVPHSGKHDRGGFARIAAIAADCEPAFALTSRDVHEHVWTFASGAGCALRSVPVDDVPDSFAEAWTDGEPAADDVLLLQYTSGSTGAPRGVCIRHRNIVANLHEIREVVGFDTAAPFVSWVPHYHDMGLMGMILYPLYFGAPSYLMSPSAFLKRPIRWLEAISRYRAGSTAAPNFAYDLCVRRVAAASLAALDLTCLTTAANGAEPIRASTLARFAETFAPCGLARSACVPSYGLAESTVFVSAHRSPLGPHEHVLPSGASAVSCGTSAPTASVKIVDPETRSLLANGAVGEIVLAGPSVADGYWGRESERVRIAPPSEDATEYLPTGDAGAIVDGHLYVVGRLKDVVIIDGRKHHAADVEATVLREAACTTGGCAVFGAEIDGAERLVVALETERYDTVAGDEADLAALRAAVLRQHDVGVHDLVRLRPGRLPRTSSGKVRRHLCRERYERGLLR